MEAFSTVGEALLRAHKYHHAKSCQDLLCDIERRFRAISLSVVWRLAWIRDMRQRRTAPGEIHPWQNFFSYLMTLNPFGDPSIGFLWRLPEKSVGLSFENS